MKLGNRGGKSSRRCAGTAKLGWGGGTHLGVGEILVQ
jgi:hypothetical protein